MLLICYPKCSTCQKAKKWLDGKDIAYTERNIAEENPTYEELKEWYEKSGLPLKTSCNRRYACEASAGCGWRYCADRF